MSRRNRLLGLFVALSVAGLMAVVSPAADSPKADSAQISKWIEQLGSDSFAEREEASKALAKIGMPALASLRKASQDKDTEIRKRAKDLLVKLEAEAATAEVLAPTRVHLVFKDTPLVDAIAELKKKSGVPIVLHDPEKKLAGKKITLDTGKTTYWDAFDKFCLAAGVVEENPIANKPVGVPGGAQPPRGGAGAGFPGAGPGPALPGMIRIPWNGDQPGQITLFPAKPARVPTDVTSSIRVRIGDKKRVPAVPAKNEIPLVLEVSPEPRLRWQSLVSITIDKAIDDNQVLLKQVENKPAPGGQPDVRGGVIIVGMGGMAMPIGPGGAWGPMTLNQRSQFLPIKLTQGEKKSKSLKEMSGTIRAHVLSKAEAMISVDNLMKAAGKSMKGPASGQIKIDTATKNADGSVTIGFEFTQPDGVVAETQLDKPVAMPANPAGPAPAPGAPIRIQIAVPAGGGGIAGGMAMPMMSFAPNGLTLRDDKGNVLPATIQINWNRAGGFRPGGATMSYLATYRPVKNGPAEPSRLVFTGRKSVLVHIPFTLKNVDLE